jgi:hypothetical protein
MLVFVASDILVVRITKIGNASAAVTDMERIKYNLILNIPKPQQRIQQNIKD